MSGLFHITESEYMNFIVNKRHKHKQKIVTNEAPNNENDNNKDPKATIQAIIQHIFIANYINCLTNKCDACKE